MDTPFRKKFGRLIRGGLRKRALGKYGTAILTESWNGRLLVEAGDFNVGRSLRHNGEYDREPISIIQGLLQPHASNVVVVGAHIGALVVPVSRFCRRMTVFEADKQNYELLEMNVCLNRCSNVTLNHTAIGDKNATVGIKRNLTNTGNTSVASGVQTENTVSMTTLDDALDDDHIDLIIMDIEGYEPMALQGAKTTLARTKAIFVEYSPQQISAAGGSSEDMLEILFGVFRYMSVMSSTGGMIHMDNDEAREWLRKLDEEQGGRGYLRDLLFSNDSFAS